MRDKQAVNAISKRVIRFINGNFGDSKRISEHLYEMRVFIGKGYRVYYTFRGEEIILLICGGHKGTQSRDIREAEQLLQQLGDLK